MSYRRYILPPATLETVKFLPSLPAAPPSEGVSYLESPSLSLSLFSLRFMLFSLRNPSCKGRSRAASIRFTVPLGLNAGAILLSGDPPISRGAAAAAGRLLLAKARRGDSRSRCRRRRLSGERRTATGGTRGLGAASMVVSRGHVDYTVGDRGILRCIGGSGGGQAWC